MSDAQGFRRCAQVTGQQFLPVRLPGNQARTSPEGPEAGLAADAMSPGRRARLKLDNRRIV